jgi:TRAP transporter 4TM/12TM fusion protein
VIATLVATGRRRSFEGAPARILTLLAAAFACWVIYANVFVISDPLVLGILFVSGILTLLFPVIGHSQMAPNNPTIIDWLLSGLSLASGMFFFLNADAISDRITLLDPFTGPQFFFGTAILLLTLEATRRTTGAGLTGIVVLFLLYNWFGYLLPPPFGHGISEFSYLLDILVFTTDGVFGVPVQVVASYVFLFVMFGTLLSKAGGGEFFFNLASAATGNSRGGPAKVAVISSGLYGTMSGSPTSDVVATGSITIPIMKRLGYAKRFAGAGEVAASTGGSAMPPIMGSAAFILAEYTGTPYREVVYAALIPAFLYYIGVFLQVHMRAVRRDLRPYNGEIPRLSRTFVLGWPFLIPIAVIVGMLWAGYSPVMTAGAGALGVVIGTALSTRTRMTPWAIIDSLGETTLRILPVAGACAAAGLVIGGLSMTGLGMKAANVIIQLSGGGVGWTLVLAAVITILLGLGMPTPSAYILAAVLVGPALMKVGLPVLESHMFLLYFAILSALTPPIAVAALAAAAIADEDPFVIAFDAVRLAAVGFLMPFVFIWNPAIIGHGTVFEIGLVALGGVVASCAVAVSFEWVGKQQHGRLAWPIRGLLLVGAAAAVAPNILISALGIVVTGAFIWWQLSKPPVGASETVETSSRENPAE